MRTTSTTAHGDGPGWRGVLHRWPSVLGIALAVPQLVIGTTRDSVAVTVAVAALCYLAAAAMNRPWVAWAAIVGGSLVVTVSMLLGVAWWVGIGVAAGALVVGGLLGGAPRPALTAQTAALLGYGGLAVVAMFLAPRAGMALAGVVLACHAGWDLVHYRRGQVVSRSLAEFCMLLDVPLGVGAAVLAIIG